jgi:hypothetical protein
MNHGVRLRALPFTARGGPDPGHPTRYSTFSPDPIRPKTGCATAATEHGRKSHPSPRQARSAWTPSLLPWHARPIHPRPSVNRSKDPNRRRRRAISRGRRGLPERGHEKETAPAVPFGVAVRLSFRRMLTVRKSIGGPPSGAMSTEGKRSLHEVLGDPLVGEHRAPSDPFPWCGVVATLQEELLRNLAEPTTRARLPTPRSRHAQHLTVTDITRTLNVSH